MDSRVMCLAEHGSGDTGPGNGRPSRTGPESHGQVVPLRTHRTALPLGRVDVPPEPLVSCHSIVCIICTPVYRTGPPAGRSPAGPLPGLAGALVVLRHRMEGADGES